MAIGKVTTRVGWGSGGTGAIPDSILQDIENLKNAKKKTINLGNIGDKPIEKAFNDKAFEKLQISQIGYEIPATGYTEITATQNEKAVVWLFTGASGFYDGNTSKSSLSDFTRISFDGEVDLEAIRNALGDAPVLAGGNTKDTAKTLRDDIIEFEMY